MSKGHHLLCVAAAVLLIGSVLIQEVDAGKLKKLIAVSLISSAMKTRLVPLPIPLPIPISIGKDKHVPIPVHHDPWKSGGHGGHGGGGHGWW